jgi:hypothetical protein
LDSSFRLCYGRGIHGNFIQAVYQLPFLFALAFPAWVFWRNIDVVSSAADPQMRIAYLVLGVISWTGVLIFGLGLLVPSDDGDTGPSLVFGLFSQFLIWGIMTLLATISLKRLRRRKIDKVTISLEELVRSMHPIPAKQISSFTTLPNLRSPGALRFILVAVILIFIYSVINIYFKSVFEETTTFDEPTPGLHFLRVVSIFSFMGACYFLLRARTKLQPAAEGVLSMDKRAPVLFLRSFVDDERVRFLQAERTLFDFSLEARLATHFFKTGPFIAVDSPNHTAAIGAARASLTNTEWQGTVVEWMHAARLIVLLAGVSQWIRWEMKQIVELGYSRKLVILMPELSRWKQFRLSLTRGLSSATDIARKRLEVIRETFSGSPWEAGINEPCVPQEIRSLMFGLDRQVTAICARSRSRDCYQLAALISEYLICNEQKNNVREA